MTEYTHDPLGAYLDDALEAANLFPDNQDAQIEYLNMLACRAK